MPVQAALPVTPVAQRRRVPGQVPPADARSAGADGLESVTVTVMVGTVTRDGAGGFKSCPGPGSLRVTWQFGRRLSLAVPGSLGLAVT